MQDGSAVDEVEKLYLGKVVESVYLVYLVRKAMGSGKRVIMMFKDFLYLFYVFFIHFVMFSDLFRLFGRFGLFRLTNCEKGETCEKCLCVIALIALITSSSLRPMHLLHSQDEEC